MLNRPTRVQTYMDIAAIWAKRSTCMRRNVGAIVVRSRRILGHGYNGVHPAEPHCAGNTCAGRDLCTLTTHAEINALDHCVTSPHGSDIFCTDSPCMNCVHRILEEGIQRVFFSHLYRLTEPLIWLVERGIGAYHVMPAGYVIEYATKNVVEEELL